MQLISVAFLLCSLNDTKVIKIIEIDEENNKKK